MLIALTHRIAAGATNIAFKKLLYQSMGEIGSRLDALTERVIRVFIEIGIVFTRVTMWYILT